MARKGFAGRMAAAARRRLGARRGIYALLKAAGKAALAVAEALKPLSPRDFAYRVFRVRGGLPAGYVVRVDRREISGVAFPDARGEPAAMELLVGGSVVNRTYASQKAQEPTLYAGRPIAFTFPMSEVWPRIRKDEAIEVLAAGRPLRYRAGPGPGSSLPNLGPRSVEGKGIAELIGEGFLINKFGRIRAPRHESESWANRAFGGYARINAIFEREFGKTLYVFYGAMLGFAREGRILAHDLDLDLAYFSDESSPEGVHREFRSIAERLARLDVGFRPQTYKFLFKGTGLSVTPTWIAQGVFSSTFGYVGDGFSVSRDDILPLSEAEHAGHRLFLPRNPQAVAAYVYGKGWKYPDPGWKWLAEYKDRPSILAARLTERDLRELAALEPGRPGGEGGRAP